MASFIILVNSAHGGFPDWWLNAEDLVYAARPSDHIPPQPATWQRRGLLQLEGWGRQGPEEPAHVRTSHTDKDQQD